MALPTISGTGRLIDDPELRYTTSSLAICTVRIACNSRKKDDAGEWVDADVCYLTGTLFRAEAEHVAESLTKGTEVTFTGKMKTRSYDDKDGNKRSVMDLIVDSIGPTLKYANVRVLKMARKSQEDAAAAALDNADTSRSVWDSEEEPF